METKLLPCPFCGEKMSMHHDHSQHKWGYFMACENKKCSVRPTQMARHDSEKEAMASCNTRVLSDDHQRLVEINQRMLELINNMKDLGEDSLCSDKCSLGRECDESTGDECLLIVRLRILLEKENLKCPRHRIIVD